MKKLILLLAVVALTMSFAACGGGDKAKGENAEKKESPYKEIKAQSAEEAIKLYLESKKQGDAAKLASVMDTRDNKAPFDSLVVENQAYFDDEKKNGGGIAEYSYKLDDSRIGVADNEVRYYVEISYFCDGKASFPHIHYATAYKEGDRWRVYEH